MLKYFVIYQILLFLSFILGLTSFRIFGIVPPKKFNYTSLFKCLMLGITTLVVSFSVTISSFKTVNILFVLLLLLFLFYKKGDLFKHEKITYKKLIGDIFFYCKSSFLLSLPFFLFEAFFIIDLSNGEFVMPFVDYIYYSDLSDFLIQTGQENKFLLGNLYNKSLTGITPYHYFELWVNAILNYIFPLSSVVSLVVVVYPFFYFMSFLGILSLWEIYGALNKKKIAISFLFLFIGGVYFSFYNSFELLRYFGGVAVQIFSVSTKKMAVIFPFFLMGLNFFIRKKNLECILFFLAACIVSIGAFPAVFIGLLVFFVLIYIIGKESKREQLKIILIILIFGLFYFLLYMVLGNKASASYGGKSIANNFISNINIDMFKQLVFKTVFPFTRLTIMYAPFIIVLLYVFIYVKNYWFRKAVFLVSVLLIIGCLAGGASSVAGVYGGGQMFSYLLPLFNAILVLSIIKLFFLSKKETKYLNVRYSFISLFFIALGLNSYNCFQNNYAKKEFRKTIYSPLYLKNITTVLNNNQIHPLGVSFSSIEDTKRYPLGLNAAGLSYTGSSLKLANSYYGTSNLSVLDLPIDTVAKGDRDYFELFEFNTFVKDQKRKNNFQNNVQSQLNFIEQFKIEYLIKYKFAQIPEKLKNHIKFELKDSLSGESFMIINRKTLFPELIE